MQSLLIIVNAPPYGSERMLSALRLAVAISSGGEEKVLLRVFMMSDAVIVGLPNQSLADADRGLSAMLDELVERGVQIRLCRTCAQARGIVDLPLVSGVSIGTLAELADWTMTADKVITF